MRRVGLLLLPFFILGCWDSSGGDAANQNIPPVEIYCDIAKNQNCGPGQSGKKVVVGWVATPSLNCEEWLNEGRAFNKGLGELFDFWGQANVVYESGGLFAEVLSWGDDVGPLSRTGSRSYSVCAYIDISGDGKFDGSQSEPVGELSSGVTLGDSPLQLIEWYN